MDNGVLDGSTAGSVFCIFGGQPICSGGGSFYFFRPRAEPARLPLGGGRRVCGQQMIALCRVSHVSKRRCLTGGRYANCDRP